MDSVRETNRNRRYKKLMTMVSKKASEKTDEGNLQKVKMITTTKYMQIAQKEG